MTQRSDLTVNRHVAAGTIANLKACGRGRRMSRRRRIIIVRDAVSDI
jgi:hypothetical protein